MNTSFSSKQSLVVLGAMLKAAAIGLAGSILFGFAFTTGVRVEKQAGQ